MANYNKLTTLKDNIAAISTAFLLHKENRAPTSIEAQALSRFSGFGGLKAILSPASKPEDIEQWSKSEQHLFPYVQQLHQVLRENSVTEAEYRSYFNSLRNSILTAFYTPRSVVDAITTSIQAAGVSPQKVLEPSAGMGEFVSSLKEISDVDSSMYGFEKDLITGKILSALHTDVKVRVNGFEEIDRRFNGFFDVVCSNIPFGDVAVFDPEFMKSADMAHKMARQSLHNYFFVKGVDTLREGGVLAYITSQGVMNSQANQPVREWLMSNTDLISAVRLPNNLFSENAGTDVGSDLIILQKRSGKEGLSNDESRFIQSQIRPKSGVVWNRYYNTLDRVVHSDFKIGTDPYGKPAMEFTEAQGVDAIASKIRAILANDFKQNFNLELYNQSIHRSVEIKPTPQNALFNLFGEVAAQQRPRRRASKPKTVTQPLEVEQPKVVDLTPRPFEGVVASHLREGSLLSSADQVGVLARDMDNNPLFQPLDLPIETQQKISAYISIRDTYHELYNFENHNHTADDATRELLNQNYDSFVKRYGYLNDRKNNDLIQMDASGRELLYLERKQDKQTVKADIFSQPVSFNPNEVTQVDTAQEALAESLNKSGGVDLEYMTSLLPEMERDEIVAELEGKIFYNPMESRYEIAEKFISGNVISKIEDIESYLLSTPDDSRAKASLTALQEARPTKIPFSDLDFNLGERWIPTGVYAAFATYLFDAEVKVAYNSSADEYAVDCRGYNAKIYDKYCVRGESRSYNGISLMKHALLNTTPDITKKITVGDKEVKVRDAEAIQLANSKIDEIRGSFIEWLSEQSDEFKLRLEDRYNNTFNCYVRPKYDGSSQSFPDLDLKGLGIPDLYQSQKDAVWMIKQNGGAICDHEVGAGKTLIMCVAAYEMKRLGLANKPMILGLKANVQELAHTFRTAYPNAKILAPGKNDFTPDKRERIFNDIH